MGIMLPKSIMPLAKARQGSSFRANKPIMAVLAANNKLSIDPKAQSPHMRLKRALKRAETLRIESKIIVPIARGKLNAADRRKHPMVSKADLLRFAKPTVKVADVPAPTFAFREKDKIGLLEESGLLDASLNELGEWMSRVVWRAFTNPEMAKTAPSSSQLNQAPKKLNAKSKHPMLLQVLLRHTLQLSNPTILTVILHALYYLTTPDPFIRLNMYNASPDTFAQIVQHGVDAASYALIREYCAAYYVALSWLIDGDMPEAEFWRLNCDNIDPHEGYQYTGRMMKHLDYRLNVPLEEFEAWLEALLVVVPLKRT